MKGQSRKHSMIEAVINVLIGYWIAIGTQALVFPMFGLHVDFATDMLIAGVFTVVSLVRSYSLRRLFNYIHMRWPSW